MLFLWGCSMNTFQEITNVVRPHLRDEGLAQAIGRRAESCGVARVDGKAHGQQTGKWIRRESDRPSSYRVARATQHRALLAECPFQFLYLTVWYILGL